MFVKVITFPSDGYVYIKPGTYQAELICNLGLDGRYFDDSCVDIDGYDGQVMMSV